MLCIHPISLVDCALLRQSINKSINIIYSPDKQRQPSCRHLLWLHLGHFGFCIVGGGGVCALLQALE